MDLLWTELMESTDSTLNQRTVQREATEKTPAEEQPWDETPVIDTTALSPDDLAAGDSLHLDAVTGFSALALRDRVVIMLLFDQVVREDQVEQAWQLWQQMGREGAKEPLWRVLMLFPELDRELVYAEAARVYGFEEARISRSKALALIKEMEAFITRDLWEQMVDLRVMPISQATQKHSPRKRVIFATSDPTRPEVHHLMPQFNLDGFELRYARTSEILNLLIEAFPRRYNHLRGLSGVTKDFLAAVYPETEEAFAESSMGIDEPVVVSSEESLASPGVSSVGVFEEVLVEAVRQQVTDVCLLPNVNGQVDVYYQINQELTRQRVIDHIPASMFITAIKSSVIRSEDCAKGVIQKRFIQRWVDDELVRFRISAVPASEEVHTECIVVRVFA